LFEVKPGRKMDQDGEGRRVFLPVGPAKEKRTQRAGMSFGAESESDTM
jgi:hypothetical protein